MPTFWLVDDQNSDEDTGVKNTSLFDTEGTTTFKTLTAAAGAVNRHELSQVLGVQPSVIVGQYCSLLPQVALAVTGTAGSFCTSGKRP